MLNSKIIKEFELNLYNLINCRTYASIAELCNKAMELQRKHKNKKLHICHFTFPAKLTEKSLISFKISTKD